MRLTITKLALATALPLFMFAGAASADATTDKLLAMCKAGDPKPESCECQVKALSDNLDPRVLPVLAATGEAESAATPEAKQKIIDDALKAAGLTQEEYEKLLGEGVGKAGPAMEACSK